jgi:hypothetical protein
MGELLRVLTTITTWHPTLREWLSTLESLSSWAHVSDALDDFIQDLMNFSILLGFLLLFDFIFR